MSRHDPIHVGMIGCGTVGQGVARLLGEHAELYADRIGRPLVLKRILVRDAARDGRGDHVDTDLVTDRPEAFFATEKMAILVEVAGGQGEIGRYVREALASGLHVVTANKSLLAASGADLFALARRHGVAIAFEASCAGGIPIVMALQFGLLANRIAGLYGILNGTCNYILTQMTDAGKSYAQALSEAQKFGYAEADPALDVGGQDAAQKLSILATLAFGARIGPDDVACQGIEQIELTDIRFASELGYQVKLLAIAERTGAAASSSSSGVLLQVQPCFIHHQLPLAQVHGTFNALSVYGDAVGHTMYLGRGAGQMPTASAVVADLMNVASGWYGTAFTQLRMWPDQHGRAQLLPSDELCSRFYLRIYARDEPGVVARVCTILGDAGISLGAMIQHEVASGRFVPVVMITHAVRQGSVRQALARIEQLPLIEGRPVCLRIVDLPEPAG